MSHQLTSSNWQLTIDSLVAMSDETIANCQWRIANVLPMVHRQLLICYRRSISMSYLPITYFSLTNYVPIFISKDISDKWQMEINLANDNCKITTYSKGLTG